MKPMTLDEICDVLTEFTIERLPQAVIPNCYGCVEVEQKKIYLSDELDSETRIKTVLHEISHAYNHMHKLKDSEKITEARAKATYREYRRLKDEKY